jgi:hypothetical protein
MDLVTEYQEPILVTARDLSSESSSTATSGYVQLATLPNATGAVFSHLQWDQLLADQIASIHQLSALKGGEYAGDEDRLANFRRNALALGLKMEQVWAVYTAKHWDAVMQYIKDQATGKSRERLEPIDGRVDDLIVYLILFKAILRESDPDFTRQAT